MDPSNDVQIDFQKIIQKYNSQIGEMAGRIVVLEAEIEVLRDHAQSLSEKLSVDDESIKTSVTKGK